MAKFYFLAGLLCSVLFVDRFFAEPHFYKGEMNNFIALGISQELEISPTQIIDDDGTIMPWFTKPFLNVLKTWDMKEWNVFEWGTGYSTIWFARHCKTVVTVDHNLRWSSGVQSLARKLSLDNVTFKVRSPGEIIDTDDKTDHLSQLAMAINENDRLYDLIIIDCITTQRNACAKFALAHIKPGGILIVDNVDQRSSGVGNVTDRSIGYNSWRLLDFYKKYEHFSFLQSAHDDVRHLPLDWRTDFWVIK